MNGIKYRLSNLMKDSCIEWIGEIPSDWTLGRVKNVFIRKNSKAKQKNPAILSLARSGVRIRDISTNEGQIAESYENYNPVEIGDFLINTMDLYSGANCNVSYVEGVISPAYTNLRSIGSSVARFFDYYFKTQYWSMALFAHGKGVSFENRWTLNNEGLMNYFVPIPNTLEQKKIANFLDIKTAQFDSIIAKKEQLIAKLEEAKKSLISEVVTGKVKIVDSQLVPRQPKEMKDSGVEWLGMIPKEWALIKLKWFVKTTSGITPLTSDYDRYYDGEINWIRSTDLNNSELFESEVKIKVNATRKYGMKLLPKGTILIAMYGGAGTIGKNSILRCESTINQAVCAIYPNQKYIPDYTFFYVNFFRPYWMIEAKGTRVDPNISQDIVRNLILLKIDTNEQKDIVTVLQCKTENLLRLIQTENNIISLLKSAKQSLISEAVTGKIDLRDWEIIEQGGAS